MICQKCGSSEVWPDYDRTWNVEAYACRLCGWRYYPAYPARMASEEELEHHMKPSRVCGWCGKPLTGHGGKKYHTQCAVEKHLADDRERKRQRIKGKGREAAYE